MDDALAEELNKAEFDPVDVVNRAMVGNGNVQEQYPSVMQLVARLDAQSQHVHAELAAALTDLQKSEKRLPHEVDLLKNDVSSFQSQQSEKLGQISQLSQSTRKASVFTELAELAEIKQRIESVRQLMLDAQQKKPAETAERAEQYAAMFANTPEEGRHTQPENSYYGFINKYIN